MKRVQQGKLQHEKSAARKKCNMEKVEHGKRAT